VGATLPIRLFLPPPSRKSTQLCGFYILPPSRNSTQLCGFGIFNSFRHGLCNGSPLFPHSSPPFPSPSISLAHHCFDRWSVGTRCAAFHLSTNSLFAAISSARTHYRFSQSFHLTKFIHRPSTYFPHATASTSNFSNSSDSCSCAVLGVQISGVPCMSSLRVKKVLSRLPSIQSTLSWFRARRPVRQPGDLLLRDWLLGRRNFRWHLSTLLGFVWQRRYLLVVVATVYLKLVSVMLYRQFLGSSWHYAMLSSRALWEVLPLGRTEGALVNIWSYV